MKYQSKSKMKKTIKALKTLVDTQTILLESALLMIIDLDKSLNEVDTDLNKRMDDFDKSLKENDYRKKKYNEWNRHYKSPFTTSSSSDDVHIETRWL